MKCYLCDKEVESVEVMTNKGAVHIDCSIQALKEAIRGHET